MVRRRCAETVQMRHTLLTLLPASVGIVGHKYVCVWVLVATLHLLPNCTPPRTPRSTESRERISPGSVGVRVVAFSWNFIHIHCTRTFCCMDRVVRGGDENL